MTLCNQVSFLQIRACWTWKSSPQPSHFSGRFVRGKPYRSAMESWNSFFDKTKLSLSDTFAVNQQEFPVFKFRSILFLSDVNACSNKPLYVLLCSDSFSSCKLCLLLRTWVLCASTSNVVPFKIESKISEVGFFDISNCSLAFTTWSGIPKPPFLADNLNRLRWGLLT